MLSPCYAHVDRSRCISCGSCASECPRSAVSI
ncbi:MAG: 4Fe-4S binding protein, partial [Deltaproteobacteria bacterium]|nr:4Fe-4S binding protein [Deltaproteobacteria bacterium]